MTITHVSHFGLSQIGQTNDNIIFEGSMGACKRMAFAHGMEVEKYEGAVQNFDECHATYAPATENSFAIAWFKGGGLIIKGRDNYSLVMPLNVWLNDRGNLLEITDFSIDREIRECRLRHARTRDEHEHTGGTRRWQPTSTKTKPEHWSNTADAPEPADSFSLNTGNYRRAARLTTNDGIQ